MIDIENYVLTQVKNAIIAQYPSAKVYGEYIDVPAGFPCVTVMESDNKTYRPTQDDSLTEHHAEVMYEINVYTNDKNGRKDKAKRIADIADSTMQSMKFTRTFREQIPNIDRTILRITMRYEGIVAEGVADSGTTTYQMYRNRS